MMQQFPAQSREIYAIALAVIPRNAAAITEFSGELIHSLSEHFEQPPTLADVIAIVEGLVEKGLVNRFYHENRSESGRLIGALVSYSIAPSDDHDCYEEYFNSIDTQQHIDDLECKAEFSFVCPTCQKQCDYVNNWDGTVSPKPKS